MREALQCLQDSPWHRSLNKYHVSFPTPTWLETIPRKANLTLLLWVLFLIRKGGLITPGLPPFPRVGGELSRSVFCFGNGPRFLRGSCMGLT